MAKFANKGSAGFDALAPAYDGVFSASVTGALQRQAVWEYLENRGVVRRPGRVLELNCGTGEDAQWLAQHGQEVLATDASASMLAIAEKKTVEQRDRIAFRQLDMLQSEWAIPAASVQLVFSNFSGINCINPGQLPGVLKQAAEVLKPGGRLVVVLFGRHCLSETAYFLLKGKWKSAFRRMSPEPASVNLDGTFVPVWYHTPTDVSASLNGLVLRRKKAIGLFVPPSYLDKRFSRWRSLKSISTFLENLFGNIPALAEFGDHILLDFEKQ